MKILLLEDFGGDKEYYLIKSEKGLKTFIKEHVGDDDDVEFIINILLKKAHIILHIIIFLVLVAMIIFL